MISSPKPNEATASSSNNSQHSPNNGYSGYRPTAIPPQRERSQYVENDGDVIQEPLRSNWWQRLSLRNKATALAIALSTLPVVAIGATSYYLDDRASTKQIETINQSHVEGLADKTNRFIFERFGDIQVLSGLRSFSDPRVSRTTSRQEKEAQLQRFSEIYGFYDSLAVFDLNGNVIAKVGADIGKNSQGQITNNIKDRDHFQQVLKTDRAVISDPSISKTTGKSSIFFVAPVKDTVSGKTIAIARTRMPTERMAPVLANFSTGGDEYHLIDLKTNQFFEATERNQIGRNAAADFAGFENLAKAQKGTLITVNKIDNQPQLLSYQTLGKIEGLPDLNWGALIAIDTKTAFASQRELLSTLLLGTVVTTLLVGLLAAYIANRATRPIATAADAVEKLGQGELDTRIRVQGQDEFAVLGSNINRMAGQIQNLLVQQEESSRQQLGIQEQAARQQTENAQQQTAAKEKLQKRALELLIEVDPISRGDLTTRANVTEDEIGTIADSYNATVENLRKIVTQVQAAAQKMTATTTSSEASVQELSTEALRQTEEIAGALDRIQEMSNSTRAVAKSAEQAEVAVQQANRTVEAGEAAMNRTVDGISAIRETVVETSTKVQRLGEASQRISKVVNLIGRFAAQTNLLALKASIEAARAGEEGRGFAILADEVRALASQSAQATTEIEGLVTAIQTETNEVAAAMESGTEQVVEGTRLVNETRQSLNNITAASAQIGALVEAIASNAVTQSQASESVTATMSNVAVSSNKTSKEAIQVSASFKELLEVANELRASAGQFKVS